jgi:copper chaperone CopZ
MYEFTVKEMTCPSCAKAVKKALLLIDAAAEIEANIVTQTVKVKSEKSEKEISASIEKAGFPVSQVKMINF